ncbi:SRPBCC family protein [Schumannella sp. 10F1B-5-1]|uniref:SRPBCC family protein n=1 Tax=Schumannella sp. 10F1B-5-1 TaxID=2590780 RepID=UPI002107AA63|nr:SRPBCC family protein [Schumannella sp. 10F1B-5-1]
MTVNEPSAIDHDAFTVRRSIRIAAAPEKVWAAITQPEHISRWFGQSTELDRLAVGGVGCFRWDDWGAYPFVIEELDPPRAIAYRWSNEPALVDSDRPDPVRSTVFRFTLEPVDGADGGAAGTLLTVVETGFGELADPAAALESNRGGWDAELDELVAYLEGSA